MPRFSPVLVPLASACLTSPAWAQEMPAEYQQVLTALVKQGDYKTNVLKVNIPRNDVTVTVANVKTPMPFGFGAWIALTESDGVHYWGTGPADNVAAAFKAALSELGKPSAR